MIVEGRESQKEKFQVKKSGPAAVPEDVTQARSGKGISSTTGLERVAAKARKSPHEKFNNLIHHLTPAAVTGALKRISVRSASGVDGMLVPEVRENLSWLLPPALELIRRSRYKALSVKRVYIPKADGSKRPLGIPTVFERSLQGAVTEILGAIYEQDFLPCSFGFRPGLGCQQALATLVQSIGKERMHFALEVDIRDFFGSLNHEWLRKNFLSIGLAISGF